MNVLILLQVEFPKVNLYLFTLFFLVDHFWLVHAVFTVELDGPVWQGSQRVLVREQTAREHVASILLNASDYVIGKLGRAISAKAIKVDGVGLMVVKLPWLYFTEGFSWLGAHEITIGTHHTELVQPTSSLSHLTELLVHEFLCRLRPV